MSVPLDRLYNFLYDVAGHPNITIHRFFPHGSRTITDLTPLIDSPTKEFDVIMHDQEPLNYELYNNIETVEDLYTARKDLHWQRFWHFSNLTANEIQLYKKNLISLNLRLVIDGPARRNCVVLVHSERLSNDLEKYEQNGFVGVYWWAHAIIARDWYRYAELDTLLTAPKVTKHSFLIYNRAWTNTREYRLKFAQLLIENNLAADCLMRFSQHDSDCYYADYEFKNPLFTLTRHDLHDYFVPNISKSDASADYDSLDYCSTQIEVVLETLFDDTRIHLTEKSLRPIACGQPFLLAAPCGSLAYLRSYGFETFGDHIDESYDNIQDPLLRLKVLVEEMKRIKNLDINETKHLYNKLQEISQRNKQLFFSQGWHDQIVSEFKHNLNSAIALRKTFKFRC